MTTPKLEAAIHTAIFPAGADNQVNQDLSFGAQNEHGSQLECLGHYYRLTGDLDFKAKIHVSKGELDGFDAAMRNAVAGGEKPLDQHTDAELLHARQTAVQSLLLHFAVLGNFCAEARRRNLRKGH